MDGHTTAALSPARASLAATPALVAALKDAALAALITFGLCIPVLLYRTDQSVGVDLILRPRWGLVAFLCALAFAARLLFHAIGARRRVAAAVVALEQPAVLRLHRASAEEPSAIAHAPSPQM